MNQMPDWNERLKSAVNNVPVPPYLETRIRSRIRAAERPGWRVAARLAPAAVALAVCASIGYQLVQLRLNLQLQESYIGAVSSQVASLMSVGLGDHIHCSVFRKYPKDAPATEEFVREMGPQYSGLIPIVRQEIPEDYRMVIAHQCRYHGRQFVHLSLRNDSRLVSVAITRKVKGESLDSQGLLPAITPSGIPIYQAGVRPFEISAFETRDYLVYFISDLPAGRTQQLMIALAPQVKDFLRRLEL